MTSTNVEVPDDDKFEKFQAVSPLTPPPSVTSDGSNAEEFAEGEDAPQFDVSEKEKYRRRRKRNNDACKRSREKKKQQFKMIERKVAQLEKENYELKLKLEELTKRCALTVSR